MPQPCNKEGEFSEIKTELRDISGIVKGSTGLQSTMLRILYTQEQMVDTVTKLTTNVSALVKFQYEVETEKKITEEQRKEKLAENKDKTSGRHWLITTIIALSSVVITLLSLIFVKW